MVRWVAEVTAIPTVVHTEVIPVVSRTVVIPVSIVVAVTAMSVPGVSTTIGGIEVWTPEVEVVTMRIAAIDAEVPVTSLPVQRAVEVAGCNVGIPLPVEEYIAQIEVTALPVDAKHIVATCNPHQVVEVNLISCLVLCIRQVQLVSHLVGQEQGLVASLLVAHCTCCHRGGQHHHQCEKHLLHNLISYL